MQVPRTCTQTESISKIYYSAKKLALMILTTTGMFTPGLFHLPCMRNSLSLSDILSPISVYLLPLQGIPNGAQFKTQ